MRIISWNTKQLAEAWRQLARQDGVDIALLQEAAPPPEDVLLDVEPHRESECEWTMPGYVRKFRTAVVRVSDRVTMQGRRTVGLADPTPGVIRVSRVGTLAVADVTTNGETITCISAYAPWENILHDPPRAKSEIFSDGSAHRLISDISQVIAGERHKVIIAGDFNILRGYGEHGKAYWAGRYATVFSRMEALGLRCLGPQSPNGRQASPWPEELPKDSLNVPTYRSNRQTPETATRQLDFVFASASIADRIAARAMNGVNEWGPSDHCRIVIDVAPKTH